MMPSIHLSLPVSLDSSSSAAAAAAGLDGHDDVVGKSHDLHARTAGLFNQSSPLTIILSRLVCTNAALWMKAATMSVA